MKIERDGKEIIVEWSEQEIISATSEVRKFRYTPENLSDVCKKMCTRLTYEGIQIVSDRDTIHVSYNAAVDLLQQMDKYIDLKKVPEKRELDELPSRKDKVESTE
jgi:hypothetical protein